MLSVDPGAFMAIENLHEVAAGPAGSNWKRTTKVERISSALFGRKHY